MKKASEVMEMYEKCQKQKVEETQNFANVENSNASLSDKLNKSACPANYRSEPMEFDLFALHDENKDTAPRMFIVCAGKSVKSELGKHIAKITESGMSRYELFNILQKKLKISNANAQRLVYLKRSWYPLVFVKEILAMAGSSEHDFQQHIELLKCNQPPVRHIKAVKELSENLCKLAGAHAADGTMLDSLLCITDEHKSNVDSFKKWAEAEFQIKLPSVRKVKNSNEWKLAFKNKVIARYLSKFFGFPSGKKIYTVSEPEIIKNSGLNFRKAFALGALTFEAGVGIKHQVEFCVSSKAFRDSMSEILCASGIKIKTMDKISGTYWRFWSNALSKEDAGKWLDFFEHGTEKWFKLYEYVNGFQGKVANMDDAVRALDYIFASKSSSKVCIKNVLHILLKLKETHRYELVDHLAKLNDLDGYGGKWAQSICHYMRILEMGNIMRKEKRYFAKKKSFGRIVRDVYILNENVDSWSVPYRPWLEGEVKYALLEIK